MHLSASEKADKCMMKFFPIGYLPTFQSEYFIHILYGMISSCIYLLLKRQINA
jgi:hypothetical protein